MQVLSELMETYSDEPVMICEQFEKLALAVLSQYNLPRPNTVDHALA